MCCLPTSLCAVIDEIHHQIVLIGLVLLPVQGLHMPLNTMTSKPWSPPGFPWAQLGFHMVWQQQKTKRKRERDRAIPVLPPAILTDVPIYATGVGTVRASHSVSFGHQVSGRITEIRFQ